MAKQPNARTNNQASAILLAASDLVATQGIGKLTIDAVAKHAGLSKGGVLYHYPTKEALLEGMLGALIETIQTRRESSFKSSQLTAMLNTIDLEDDSDRASSLAILAAAAQKPKLLAPAKSYYIDRLQEVKKESTDKEFAGILLLALEGMRFLSMLELNPWSKAETKRIYKRMHNLADEMNP